MRRRIIAVIDNMQQGYCYVLTAGMGRQFHPEFRPELSPKQMLRLGVFYGKHMNDRRDEFPRVGLITPSSRPLAATAH